VVKVLATGEELSPRGNSWNRAISRYATENWNREIFSAQCKLELAQLSNRLDNYTLRRSKEQKP